MNTIKKILWKLYRIFVFRPYFLLRTAWPVWWYIINREGRKMFASNPPELDSVQRKIVEDLRKNGIALTHINELFPGEKIFDELLKHANEQKKKAAVRTGKTFLRYLWDTKPLVDPANPFVRFALHNRALAVVNSYLRMWAKFHAMTLNITTPVPASEKPRQSQRWHRDSDDKIICKMFIYLNDVNDGAGPFIYVMGSQYGGKWRHLFLQLPPAGSVPPRGAVEERVPKEDIRICAGRAGTIVFADTSGLHQGGYATAGERIMFTAAYFPPACFGGPVLEFPDNIAFKARQWGLPEAGCYAIKPYRQTPFRKLHTVVKKALRPGINRSKDEEANY